MPKVISRTPKTSGSGSRVASGRVPDSPRSMVRLLGLFEAVSKAADGLSLAELSVTLSSPKSSLLLMLRPLAASGHLLHADSRYRLGPTMFQFAEGILRARQSSALIRGFMQTLRTRSQETIILVAIDRAAQLVTYVECLDSPQHVRYVIPAGTTRPLYCSAGGQVLLAFQDPAWQERYLRRTRLVALTPKTIVDRTALQARLREIREAGISVSIAEAVPGAAGLAAPILRADGTVQEALLVAGPVDRLERNRSDLRALVIDAARQISAALGYGGARNAA